MSNENNYSNCEIVSVRNFNYPKELVFKAWSNPDLLADWWGPNGFTNSFHQFDFNVGGSWKFTMHGPDGAIYKNEIVFTEIVEPDRIVFEHLLPVHHFKATTTFGDLADKTRLSFCMLFDSVEECEKVKNYIIDANEQNFDRLEAVLSKIFALT